MERREQHKAILARRLRQRLTDAEQKLWLALRDRRLENYKFRRQVPIGPYIADFACKSSKLIVEADGGQHAVSKSDERRTKYLEDEGYVVLRFWNNDILENLEGVLHVVSENLSGIAPSPEASPHPLPKGARDK